MTEQELIFDWNNADLPESSRKSLRSVQAAIHDETLRDGRQATSYIKDFPLQGKKRILDILGELKIDSVNIGYPGSSSQEQNEVLSLGRYAGEKGLLRKNSKNKGLTLTCAARTHINDINPIIDVSIAAGVPIEVGMFLRSSQLGSLVQGWSLDDMLRIIESNVTYAVRSELPVMFVAEDFTRSAPSVLEKIYEVAISCGSGRICVADTVGFIEIEGLSKILKFLHDKFTKHYRVSVDCHFHNDLGDALINAIYAYRYGADRVHATWGGVGERNGNTPLDVLLVRLNEAGTDIHQANLHNLKDYVDEISDIMGYSIPPNYPVFGSDAQTTQAGIHSDGFEKAEERGFGEFKNVVYKPYNPEKYGGKSEFKIGYMSGSSTVRLVFRELGIVHTLGREKKVLEYAKKNRRILKPDEVLALSLGFDELQELNDVSSLGSSSDGKSTA